MNALAILTYALASIVLVIGLPVLAKETKEVVALLTDKDLYE